MICKAENAKKLSDPQEEAIRYINEAFNRNINPICALGPGLGKTLVACEVIWHLINENKDGYRILIIHKASNYKTWKDELDDFFVNDKTDYIYIHGTKRNKFIFGGKYILPDKMIYLSSYDTLSLDIENEHFSQNVIFDIIIFDELHTIINSKRLTNKNQNIYNISAFRKLSLTATPIQNENEEIGIQYVFLNDIEGFSKLIKLYPKPFELEDLLYFYYPHLKKKDRPQKKLKEYLDEYTEQCKKKNALFYYDEEKSGFEKNIDILSLPIDDTMLNGLYKISSKPIPTRLQFLSHPEAIYKINNKSSLPRCTKTDAVKIILQSMLNNEKAIIFSQYIDVLIAYSNLCNILDLSWIMITGDDKGKKLEENIDEFKNSKKCRVLLTTLQKSAEGFNFPFATHAIILEFWWNPQKIIQAMSRIDRKTQKRNIFIYLLCYNVNGEMLELEKNFYDRIIEKLEKAYRYYGDIEKEHPKKNHSLQVKYKNIPEPKIFKNIKTFEDELKKYIAQFQHTAKKENTSGNVMSFPLNDVKNNLLKQGYDYISFNNMIKNVPWRLGLETQESFLYLYCQYKLRLGNERENINIPSDKYSPRKLARCYLILFYKKISLDYHLLSGINDRLNLVYLVGKKINGTYDFLGFYSDPGRNCEPVFKYLKEKGIEDIRIIITSENIMKSEKVQFYSSRYFYNAKYQLCMANILRRISSKKMLDQEELSYIDKIFSAENMDKATHTCNECADNIELANIDMFKGLTNILHNIDFLYDINSEYRKIIGTNNIITYIEYYLKILLGENVFPSPREVLDYISYASEYILVNGKKFIPNWDFLITKIDGKFIYK
jgi:superfamily II DNA or RNA helicase